MEAGRGRAARAVTTAVAVAAGVGLAAAGFAGSPAALADVSWYGVGALWAVWLPVAAGLLLTWVLGSRTGQIDLDLRVQDAMEGHPVRLELGLLLAMLLGYAVGTAGLSTLIRQVSEELPSGVALPVTRLVFFFVLPVLFVDQGGFSTSGHGTRMPALSLAVREPWRWLGLVTVAAVGVPILLDLESAAAPTPTGTLLVVLAILAGVSAIEEIFFRGMVQTRLELLAGRTAAVVVTALLYALAQAVSSHYNTFTTMVAHDPVEQVAVAVVTYGVQGLLLGYIWIRYRNMWINTLVHGVPLVLATLPTVAGQGGAG
ncbi:CPBP family intramembrane glutamic endopeptidase [Nocardiopsis suaedae]|uniref:CPBP family intramembrane glutamic endopeptidase n=1 Tax=Nocardiopsis suaedae TaxID=3018444 RepID=UPI0022E06A28|nr:CPBP family intramembrane glutamic endopeptidase [Nocardiopsis suaedae]